MQNYGSVIQLTDRMTPVLTNIMNAVNMTVSSVYQLQEASSVELNSASFSSINENLAQAQVLIDEINSDFNRTGNEIDQSRNKQVRFNNAISAGNSQVTRMHSLFSRVMTAAGSYMGMQGIKESFTFSDEITNNEARISLMLDNGSVQDVKSQIYAAAQNSRGYYADMMNSVSRLSLLAGQSFSDAYGNVNYDEVIRFQELMNKNFVIGGASASEQSSAMYQLTQAMSSGRLQGDEYRSIIENAPLLAKSIEDYMSNAGVKGTLKEWASEGLLTADVIKAAVFSSADEIEQRFSEMPMTWGQVVNGIKNRTVGIFDPVLKQINSLANNQEFMTVFNNLINGVTWVAGAASVLIDILANGAVWISNNWGYIAPVIIGVAAAIGAVKAAQTGYAVIHAITTTVSTAKEYLQAKAVLKTAASHGIKASALTAEGSAAALAAAGLTAEQVATASATVAQQGFNAAMLASPVAWVILGIIALIAVIFIVINAIQKVTGTTTSACGMIFGAICWLGALILNTVIGLINGIIQFLWTRFVEPFIGIIEWILNACNGGFDSFGGAVANLIGNVISWFLSLGKVVTTIIDAIFGTDWTGGLNSLQDEVLAWGKTENSITISRDAPQINYRMDMTDAYNWGATKGDSFWSGIKDKFSFKNELENSAMTDYAASMADYTGTIVDTTSDISDTVSASSDEELEWLRKLAERETVNRFTTAEIKLDFSSTATLNSDMDIDGYINTFTTELEEVLVSTAEDLEK